jgi:tRNA(Leu) C34 or U34 (ribose-2'-O)-methylase TrmL
VVPSPAAPPIHLVLVEPSGPLNVGSVARLCANFAIAELRLVAPRCDPLDPLALRMAVHGGGVLASARRFASLADALADCGRVVAASGRQEGEPLVLQEPCDALGWLLAGGSAWGLDAAAGVMRWLEEQGIGLDVRFGLVPIVPAAVLFDLPVGDARIRPDAQAGYLACQAASRHPPAQGNVGAGAGALVGKLFGLAREENDDDTLQSVEADVHGVDKSVAEAVAGKVSGLGDLWTGQNQPAHCLTPIRGPGRESLPHLLLNHNPDARLAAMPYHWDLMLCGHTHGGQIRLPWFGGSKSLTTNCDLENWRSRGVTKVNNEPWLNVSAGMGMSPFAPIRFACPPEVSLITLTA